MAIPVLQFQPQTFAQAHPGMTGAAAGLSLVDQLAALKGQQAKTKLAQEQAKTLPITAEAQLLGATARGQMSKYMLSPERQFGRILRSPQLMSLMGSNPHVARYITNALAGMSQRLGGKLQPNEGEVTVQPGVTGTPQITNLPHPAAINPQYNAGSTVTGDPVTDQDVTDMQANMRDTLLRKQMTAQILNQRQYGSILDNLFDRGNTQINAVSRYAGALGKAKGSLQAVKSMLGNTSDAFAKYTYFTRHTVPTTVNEMRRTLGGQASDKEIALMNNLANPLFWDSNPTLAVGSWNDLENLYKGVVDPALAARISETTKKLRGERTKAPLPTQLSQIRAGIGNTVRMKTADGQVWNVPVNKVALAEKRGAKRT